MHWILKQIRKYKVIVSVMIGLIGLSLIWVDNNVLFGIGISILASAITSTVTFIFLDDEDDYKDIKQWGLEKVYPTRGEMNKTADRYLKKTNSVKVIAFGLRSWRDSQGPEIRRILAKGGSVKIITMKPNCQNLKAREADERQNISDSIRELIEWAKGLDGDIQIRYHDHMPQMFVFILSNRLFTGPYEYGNGSQQTISFEYNNIGTAYEYYENYFDRLWNDSSFCEDALG